MRGRLMGGVVHAVPAGFRQFRADFRFTQSLLHIVRLVQRHRALCAGGELLAMELPAVHAAVTAAVDRALTACPSGESAAGGEQAFVEELEATWQCLVATRADLSAEMVFLRHCRLLEGLLERVGRLADEWAGLDRERERRVSTFARQLPALAEALGQIDRLPAEKQKNRPTPPRWYPAFVLRR